MMLYRVFGCNVASEVVIPGLLEATGEPEVFVRFGPTPVALPGARGGLCFSATPDEVLISLGPVGSFLVRDGKEILVAPAQEADESTLRLFVLNLALGILLHQRGEVVLHAAAVEACGGCIAIAGLSAAGKSAVAAALHGRGRRAIADEVVVIRDTDRGRPLRVEPGPPFLQVWADVLHRLDRDVTALTPVRPGLEKYFLPLESGHQSTPLSLRAIYVLSTWNRDAIELGELAGSAQILALVQSTYRLEYIGPMGLRERHFARMADIASRVPVVQVQHPGAGRTLGDLVDTVAADLEARVSTDEPQG